jgi:hypothetical protein
MCARKVASFLPLEWSCWTKEIRENWGCKKTTETGEYTVGRIERYERCTK